MASNSKRKRNVLNIEAKLEILNHLVKRESGASLAQFYNVGKSTISDIKKSRETILNFASKLDSEDCLEEKDNHEGSKRCCS
ncbi:jerky-like protein [Trichonephila clavipes]|nr:jerky-like protein [Trichonephila clavipes]